MNPRSKLMHGSNHPTKNQENEENVLSSGTSAGRSQHLNVDLKEFSLGNVLSKPASPEFLQNRVRGILKGE